MEEDANGWSVAICGLNCAKCDMFEASHGNEKLMEEIVEWFRKERNESVKPEQIRCEGCRGPLDAHWSSDCKMMLCAKEKGHRYCFQCDDFPCKILTDFASDGMSHHRQTVENLKAMKRMGLDAWIAEQEAGGKREFCP